MGRRHRLRAERETLAVAGSLRDLDLLADLAWAGFMSTDQIMRLQFPTRRRAQKRLRALFDLGLVRAHLQGEALHRPNVYTLSPKGLDLLVEHERFAPDALPKLARVPRMQKLRHALTIREVFVAFRRAEKDGLLSLEEFLFEEQLAGVAPFAAHGLVPDGLADITSGRGRERFGVEVDLGTETTTTLRDKFERWRALYGMAGPVSALLVVTPRSGRATVISRLLRETRLGTAAQVVLVTALDEHLRLGIEAQGTGARTGRGERPVLRRKVRVMSEFL